jgi:hypothetical protein
MWKIPAYSDTHFFDSLRQVLQAFWTITMQTFELGNPKSNKINTHIKLIKKLGLHSFDDGLVLAAFHDI